MIQYTHLLYRYVTYVLLCTKYLLVERRKWEEIITGILSKYNFQLLQPILGEDEFSSQC
jgi:hypothetical protein